jgi:outer membrane scaffolding protein for murein synthesis (MipA/OmpV family)
MRIGSLRSLGYIGVLSIGLASQASAQETPDAGPPPAEGWRVDVGGAVLAYPRYPGSKSERVLPLPSIEAHYGDSFFASVREGIGYNLFRWDGFEAGPVANFAFPRDESDKPSALKGLGNIDLTVEAGGFVRYNLDPFASAKVEARQGVNGHRGLVVDMSLDLNAPPLANNRLFLSAGPRFSYYDRNYAQAYFGVTALQSARSGYAPFLPKDGDKAGVGIAAVYLIDDRVTWTVFGDYSRLSGDIAKSPIVRSPYGARDQVTVGSALTYRFDFGN